MPRKQVERLPDLRPFRDAQDSRKKVNCPVSRRHIPAKAALVPVFQIGQMPRRRQSDELTRDDLAAGNVPRILRCPVSRDSRLPLTLVAAAAGWCADRRAMCDAIAGNRRGPWDLVS